MALFFAEQEGDDAESYCTNDGDYNLYKQEFGIRVINGERSAIHYSCIQFSASSLFRPPFCPTRRTANLEQRVTVQDGSVARIC